MRLLTSLLSLSMLTGFAVFSSSCTDAKTSVFVRHVAFPSFDEGGCAWDADPSGAAVPQGNLDVGYASTYQAAFSVGNQLVPRGNTNSLRPESNRVQFYEVDVEVYDFSGSLLSEYSVPATGFADPGAATAPGYGIVFATIIDASVADAVRAGTVAANQTMVSRVVVRGVTLGGIEVETAPYDFPIFVENATKCIKPPNDDCEADLVSEVCFVGQDFRPDCRQAEAETNVESTDCPI